MTTNMDADISNLPKTEKEFRNFLPTGFDYEIAAFAVRSSTEGSGFEATFNFDVLSPVELNTWQKQFEEKSKTTYRIRDSKCGGTVYAMKKRYSCHRNTRSAATCQTVPNSRNTNCPSLMTVKLKKPFPGENHLKCLVALEFIHNHVLGSYVPPKLRKPAMQRTRKRLSKVQNVVLKDTTSGVCNIPPDLRIILTMEAADPSESQTAVQCLEQLPVSVSDLIDAVPNFVMGNEDPVPMEQTKTMEERPDYNSLLQGMFEDLQQHLMDNPALFGPPVSEFCAAFKNMSTVEEKVAAMLSFGK